MQVNRKRHCTRGTRSRCAETCRSSAALARFHLRCKVTCDKTCDVAWIYDCAKPAASALTSHGPCSAPLSVIY